MKESVYDEGTVILKSGDISDKVFIVWRGEIHAQINNKDKITYFDSLNQGGCMCAFSAFSDDMT